MPTDGLKWSESPDRFYPPASSDGRAVARVTKTQERVRRVEAFRAAVTSGTYRVDSFMVADRLLDRRVLERDDL
jgi:Anti-sigma-28 factor, FlgM